MDISKMMKTVTKKEKLWFFIRYMDDEEKEKELWRLSYNMHTVIRVFKELHPRCKVLLCREVGAPGSRVLRRERE